MLQRLEVIDFLRGFSIFTIVLMHLLQSFPISPFLSLIHILLQQQVCKYQADGQA